MAYHRGTCWPVAFDCERVFLEGVCRGLPVCKTFLFLVVFFCPFVSFCIIPVELDLVRRLSCCSGDACRFALSIEPNRVKQVSVTARFEFSLNFVLLLTMILNVCYWHSN